ncbi:uncharacterized protein LOC130962856 [Arachis stenosperma]|uniref:uncharacterized protein LOC130962856 n=1 Tax=Arachis stenosperma TaxID=217475 RepID=UPI0025AB5F04|nr:uncharacterized protein LOC130962856 [Arachis stenosperma]
MRDDDSDQVPLDIIGDSDDDTGANPHTQHGPSSSATQQYPPYFSTLNLEALGQQADGDEAVLSVKDYSIRRGVEYRVLKSDHLKYHGKYKEFGKGSSCDHRQLDYHIIYARIYPLVKADVAVTVKVLQQATEADYGFRPSYRKVWMEKQKAVAQIYGDWEESYTELPRWMLGVQSTMAGTVTVLKTSPVRLGDQYGGTLLLAIAQDGNSNILLIAFALVEGENAESWSFFLSNLRSHVTPQEGILVISDSHNGIKAALEAPKNGWLPPCAFQAFCIRHVAANFSLSFKGKDARRMLVNTAYAKTEAEFYYWCDIMRTKNLAMCDWANRMEYDKWTQHQDSGRRFGHMTTNISKCANSMLNGTRNLPVIDRKIRDSRCFTVTLYDRHQSEYTVAETTPTGNFSLGSYRVSFKDHTCDCGHFQALHYPCCHAIACCAHSRLNWASYVHEVYRMSEVFNVYKQGFVPPIPEGLWPPYAGPTVILDPNMKRAREGRPKATRFGGSMDQSIENHPKRCGLCRQPGHMRRNCDQRRHTTARDG